MGLFVDVQQYSRIAQAQGDANEAKRKAQTLGQRLDETERRLDRLSLACQALWELLSERTGLTQQQVYGKMEEIDLRDGKRDGRMSGTVSTCESCNRTINSRNSICVYCGCPVRKQPFV